MASEAMRYGSEVHFDKRLLCFWHCFGRKARASPAELFRNHGHDSKPNTLHYFDRPVRQIMIHSNGKIRAMA